MLHYAKKPWKCVTCDKPLGRGWHWSEHGAIYCTLKCMYNSTLRKWARGHSTTKSLLKQWWYTKIHYTWNPLYRLDLFKLTDDTIWWLMKLGMR